ncbi:hypothetical protein NLI96_g9502 [Meripilus lineatus]|uniref:PCI domain-containing protein n=1 Tax=Meripilus lineatus TaxID=2056292 RepID=A0AAD5UVC3_9APHY|nr:hypothetical protein NLI96_g9502 [Physisporinus lineatus]
MMDKMMDIDLMDEFESPASQKLNMKRPAIVPIDDNHPFDLDAYINTYSGRTQIDRLIFLLPMCPTLAPQAYIMALQLIQKSRDTTQIHQLNQAYDSVLAVDSSLPSLADLPTVEQKWAEDTNSRNNADRQRLEVELKTYSSNMIKESIRMAYRDLGDFYRSTGDFSTSLKHYTKSREFCTTGQHVLDMCMSVLELLLEQRNYAHITTYVFKADAALESSTTIGRTASSGAQSAPPSREKIAAEREKVQTKLDAAAALANLGQGAYDKAAKYFLKLGPIKGLEHWASTIVSPSDIAIYTTLCALATFHRSVIKAQLLDNDNFSVYMEQEPYVREIITAYLSSRFNVVLENLERFSTRHNIDIQLSGHVAALTNQIRSRAIVLYFQPFASIKLDRMSTAFGWTNEQLEQQVVSLIEAGEIQARVDRQNQILKAKETDQRAVLFSRALKAGQDMAAANRKLLLRMRLQQADLTIKVPRSLMHPSEYLQ